MIFVLLLLTPLILSQPNDPPVTTPLGCKCQHEWFSDADDCGCTAEYNGCCNCDGDPQGSWCLTVDGTCGVRAKGWDYCGEGACVAHCPTDIDPMCGTNGVTYVNQCELERKACTDPDLSDLETICEGECPCVNCCVKTLAWGNLECEGRGEKTCIGLPGCTWDCNFGICDLVVSGRVGIHSELNGPFAINYDLNSGGKPVFTSGTGSIDLIQSSDNNGLWIFVSNNVDGSSDILALGSPAEWPQDVTEWSIVLDQDTFETEVDPNLLVVCAGDTSSTEAPVEYPEEPIINVQFSDQPAREGKSGYSLDENEKREFYCSSTDGFEDRSPSTWHYTFIVADGMMSPVGYDPRHVLVVNGTIPGPTVYACENDTVIVDVINNVEIEQVSIHWHGILMRWNHFMDGVSMVSHCPIGSQTHEPEFNTYQYKYIAEPQGTSWYHSHAGAQYSDGFIGGIVIFEYEGEGVYDADYDDEVPLILIYDWWNGVTEYLMQGLVFGQTPSDEKGLPGTCYKKFTGESGFVCGGGGATSDMAWEGGAMNQEGQYIKPGPGGNSGAYHTARVKSNRRYRFRFVNAGANFGFRVSFDNHKFDVIASDMQYMKKVENVDAFVFFAGERYDVILHADQDPTQNYWIRATTFVAKSWTYDLDAEPMPMFKEIPSDEFFTVLGVLSYKGINGDPTTTDTSLLPQARVLDITQFVKYPKRVVQITEYNGYYFADLFEPPEVKKTLSVNGLMFPNYQLFLTVGNGFTFGDIQAKPTTYQRPKRPITITRGDPAFNRDNNIFVRFDEFPKEENMNIANKTQTLIIPGRKMVRFYLRNPGPMVHPFHMHGHYFWVLGTGQDLNFKRPGECCTLEEVNRFGGKYFNTFSETGTVNGTAGHVIIPGWNDRFLKDIDAQGELRLNLLDPPRKDTIPVPHHGWAMIQFYSDNPGAWFFHCHLEPHLAAGMGVVIMEDVASWNEIYPKQTVDYFNRTECLDVEFQSKLF